MPKVKLRSSAETERPKFRYRWAMLTDADLEILFRDQETDRVERKAALAGRAGIDMT